MERRVTSFDLSWFIDARRNGQLDLSPPYQRKSVWSPRDRRFFIDTIFHDYPSPPIFLHKSMDDSNAKYAVVDGKQRLETIFLFIDGKIRLPENFGDDRLDNKRWSEIKNIIELSHRFYNYILPVEIIPTLPESRFLNEVFDRLNRNSRKLTEQELRHAKYDGWFASTVENEAMNKIWSDLKVRTLAREKRMKDMQFISELFMVIISGKVRGFDQSDIDWFYAEFDDLTSREDEGFDEAEVLTKFTSVRDFIHAMGTSRPFMFDRLKYVGHLYSLFGCLALNPNLLNSEPDNLAGKYLHFMDEVDHSQGVEINDDNLGSSGDSCDHASSYKSATLGPSTDEAPRTQRHDILSNVLLEGVSTA